MLDANLALGAELGTSEAETIAVPVPDYCNDVKVMPATWGMMADSVFRLVNERRSAGATCGDVVKPPVTPLVNDPAIYCAAAKHAKDMAANNYLSHIGQNGWTALKRITTAGYTPLSYAEQNIAAGYSTAAAVVDAWMANPQDCNNIMAPMFVNAGVSYYGVTGSTYGYWTMTFGRP